MGGVTLQSNNAVKKISYAWIPSLHNLFTPFSSREHQTNCDELSFQFYLKSSSSLEELLLKELKQFICQLFINCAYKTRTDGLPHVLVTSHNFLELPAEGENLKK